MINEKLVIKLLFSRERSVYLSKFKKYLISIRETVISNSLYYKAN